MSGVDYAKPGDTNFGTNVATTLLTPLAEVEEDISFSPTLMVVLTALACEYAGRIPVSPLHLLRGLSRRLISYPGLCSLSFYSLPLIALQYLFKKLVFYR